MESWDSRQPVGSVQKSSQLPAAVVQLRLPIFIFANIQISKTKSRNTPLASLDSMAGFPTRQGRLIILTTALALISGPEGFAKGPTWQIYPKWNSRKSHAFLNPSHWASAISQCTHSRRLPEAQGLIQIIGIHLKQILNERCSAGLGIGRAEFQSQLSYEAPLITWASYTTIS